MTTTQICEVEDLDFTTRPARRSNASRYFATDTPDSYERERLGLLTRMTDPITTHRIQRLGIAPGWRCLEVGAGDGSVARWLAGRVGLEGQVVATDINPRFLQEQEGMPNLEVRSHDILTDPLEHAHYHLVHCRSVLEHLSDPWRALERMAAALRPGGWLLVEASDFGLSGAVDPRHPRSAKFNQIGELVRFAIHARGVVDFALGRRLPSLLEDLGLFQFNNTGSTLFSRGGEDSAHTLQMSVELFRRPLVKVGVLSDADFDALHDAYDDPTFRFVVFTMFAAWGRRHG
jgi:SAM-dependent methyltransferase